MCVIRYWTLSIVQDASMNNDLALATYIGTWTEAAFDDLRRPTVSLNNSMVRLTFMHNIHDGHMLLLGVDCVQDRVDLNFWEASSGFVS
jgi:hypothetical protein